MEEDCTSLTEEIIEKLKLLNYEKEFIAKKYILIIYLSKNSLNDKKEDSNLYQKGILLSRLTQMSNSTISRP
jgi:hypothetical protein